jgi:hypothetical protein
MRGFFKIFLPPIAAFVVFTVIIKLDAMNYHFRFGQISDGTIHSLMAYFHFFWPLLFADALLTQAVIVIPLWNRLHHATIKTRITTIILLVVTCLIFSLGVSFMMWGTLDYLLNWLRSFIVMVGVQLIYWFIVLSLLSMLEKGKGKYEKVQISHQDFTD